jgi:GntR family transcriptional regulator of vanillate catabolism
MKTKNRTRSSADRSLNGATAMRRITDREKIGAAAASASQPVSLAQLIREQILDGKLKADERLNEVRLARELAVSRTPVRAALQTLAGEGLLVYTPNKGYTVQSFPLSEIVDAYEIRALLEGMAARLAAERGITESDAARIEQALAQGDRMLAGRHSLAQKRAAYSTVNTAFHEAIQHVAGSRLLKDVIRLCQQVPQSSSRNIMAFDLDDVRKRHDAHHRIFEAIISREPSQAEALMRQHVASVKVSIVKSYLRRNSAASAGGRGRERNR